MRCRGPIAYTMLAVALAGCAPRGPQVVTSIAFDDATGNITTSHVFCTQQPGGGLVILVSDTPRRTVRFQLTQQGRLAVQKAGLRYDGMSGYVEDPREVTATKVDDTFTIIGRMPPNPGESQWHTFKVSTTCPGYSDAPPPQLEPPRGAP